MTYKKLQSKTPKQLKTFLYNYGWNKSDIKEMIGEEILTEDRFKYIDFIISTSSFESILELYHDIVVDLIWEELCNA